MANRKKATAYVLRIIERIQAGNENVAMYTTWLESMTDKQFATLMGKLADGSVTLPYYQPNLKTKPLAVDNLLKIADTLKINFFQKIIQTDDLTGVKYKSNKEYMVLRIPIRRQSQHLVNGLSVATGSTQTDQLTGQAAGKATKTVKISLPETMILESAGLNKSIEELLKVRGGDDRAYKASRKGMVETGTYNLSTIEQLDTRPTSTDTVNSYLKAMHLENNI